MRRQSPPQVRMPPGMRMDFGSGQCQSNARASMYVQTTVTCPSAELQYGQFIDNALCARGVPDVAACGACYPMPIIRERPAGAGAQDLGFRAQGSGAQRAGSDFGIACRRVMTHREPMAWTCVLMDRCYAELGTVKGKA
jgi:hypothetical protein